MSFRELRNFTETMRLLGYPRLISMENFRTPNFELTADILYWLLQRYDPNIEISDEISTETDRVAFLKSVAQIMATRARIKLNTKKLYGADGYAVKELLKIATMLRNATQSVDQPDDDDDDDGGHEHSILAKLGDVKSVRGLASELTAKGATMYDLLANEAELRELRNRALTRPLELEDVERSLRGMIQQVNENVESLKEMIVSQSADEANLEAKIEKKKAELERNQKRLRSLASVRPAFMDEYEKLEVELQDLYSTYIERFRNLEYLETELDRHNRAEQEKLEDVDRKLDLVRKRLKDEELRILRGEEKADEAEFDDPTNVGVSIDALVEEAGRGRSARSKQRPRAASGRAGRPGGRQAVVRGNMYGEDDEESSSDLSGLDDLSDAEVSIAESEEDDEDLLIQGRGVGRSYPIHDDDDEDEDDEEDDDDDDIDEDDGSENSF